MPTLHPHVDMSVLPQMGTVLSHGYLVCGFLPTRVVFPALAYILLGTEVEAELRHLSSRMRLCPQGHFVMF